MSKYLVVSKYQNKQTVHGRYDEPGEAAEHCKGLKYLYKDLDVQVVPTGKSNTLKKSINNLKAIRRTVK